MSDPQTILVYSGLDLVGDGLMKLPFLRALRQACPAARITYLAGKGRTVYAGMLAPLVAGLIDEVIEDAGIGISWRELAHRPLQGRRFDLVIDTQRRIATTLVLSRIRHGAFVSSAADWRLSSRKPRDRTKQRRMVDALLQLVEVASEQPPKLDLPLTLDTAYVEAAKLALPGDGAYAGFSPGAGGVRKRWPLDRFVAVAKALETDGLIPVFLLGPDETAFLATIREQLPRALFPLQAEGTLRKSPLFTIAVASRLAVAVANDSGTGHMIAAADAPLLSLFGPTPPAKFAPYVTRGAIIRAQDHDGEEMDAISVEAVVEAARRLYFRVVASEGRPRQKRSNPD